MTETTTNIYEERTKKNVEIADATLIISRKTDLTGGALATMDFANQLQKLWLHINEMDNPTNLAQNILAFIIRHRIQKLNIAGPRTSEAPGMEKFVTDLLTTMYKLSKK